jgi:hypothetical protein
LHHFRTGEKIPTKPVDERWTDSIPLAVMQNVKVGDGDFVAEEFLNDLLVLVVSPYGVDGHLKRFISVDKRLEFPE